MQDTHSGGGPVTGQQIVVGDKKLWLVEADQTRTARFYVLAESQEEADEDANQLVSAFNAHDWETVEDSVWVREARHEPDPQVWVWTGGSDGHETTWAQLDAETAAEQERAEREYSGGTEPLPLDGEDE